MGDSGNKDGFKSKLKELINELESSDKKEDINRLKELKNLDLELNDINTSELKKALLAIVVEILLSPKVVKVVKDFELKSSAEKLITVDSKKELHTVFNEFKRYEHYNMFGAKQGNYIYCENVLKTMFERIDILSGILPTNTSDKVPTVENNHITSSHGIATFFEDFSPKLTIRQIALKLVYEGIQVTRVNANEIVSNYGHKSGEKLYQLYTEYLSTTNRTGKPIPCTAAKLKSKIKLFDVVVGALAEPFKSKAISEREHLKDILNSEDF